MAKKKNKSLLPKRIAGVKVPRALRKGRAARFLASPVGVVVMSEALAAAGAMAAGKRAKPGSALRRFVDQPAAGLAQVGQDAQYKGAQSADALRGAFSAAAAAFADALRHSAEAIEPDAKKPRARTETRAAH
jgi:hypothetical protein